jgi:hypothetical protein
MPEIKRGATVAVLRVTVWRIYHERDPRYSRYPMGRELIARREMLLNASRRAFVSNDLQSWMKVQLARGYQVVIDPVFIDPEVVATMPISKRAQSE